MTALPRTGARLGRYVLGERLGEGGMGTVWAAHDPELDRRVAVKILHSGGDAEARSARLRKEAQALARLNHPNVMAVYDVGVWEEQPFVAMELVDGPTVRAWQREGHRSLDEILDVFRAAGEGLAAAHRAGLVHRDFKPDNVLLGSDGRVRITDFGLAASAAPGRAAGADGDERLTLSSLGGTPAYMAPEQHVGAPADARSDQFSFSVALYEGLYGERPFGPIDETLPTTVSVGLAVVQGAIRPVPPGSRVPAALRRVALRGLAVDPARRWASMDQLLAALARARHRPWWPIAAVALAALVAVGLVLARGHAAPPPLEVRDVRSITLADGCEEMPALSPDGETLVYSASMGDSAELLALDLESGATRRLTDSDDPEFTPAISPDGFFVAYIRQESGSGNAWIRELAVGGAARRWHEGSFRPTWSPDGQALWTGSQDAPVRLSFPAGQPTRRLAAPPGSRLIMGRELADGRFVAIRIGQHAAVWADAVLLYEGDAPPRTLYEGDLEYHALAVAPGGGAVYVSRVAPTRQRVLMRVPLDGGPATLAATADVQPTSGIDVGPGGRIVWSTCREHTGLVAIQGSWIRSLPTGDWNDGYPMAIPGTTRLLVYSDRSGPFRPWIVDRAQRTAPRPLVEVPGLDPMPAVPAGEEAVFVDGARGLYAVKLDGSAAPRLLVEKSGLSQPAYDLRGGWVYFTDPGGFVARIPLTGGNAERVLPDGTSWPAPSPVDGELLFVKDLSPHGLPYRRDATTGEMTRLSTDLPPAMWGPIVVSPDGRYVAIHQGASTIYELERSTGKVLRQLHDGKFFFLGATYLGDEIIAARTQYQGDLWGGRWR